MKFEFAVHESDFIELQLFLASRSPSVQRKLRRGYLILTVGTILLCLASLYLEQHMLALYWALCAVGVTLFYPRFFKWRYLRHYTKHVKEHYASRFGQQQQIELTETHLIATDKTGESKINLSEITQLDETQQHLYLKISSGQTLALPKDRISELTQLKDRLTSTNAPVNVDLDWKW